MLDHEESTVSPHAGPEMDGSSHLIDVFSFCIVSIS